MDSINTDINSYTVDELFSLLDISIEKESNTQNIKKLIVEKTNMYIKTFTELERMNLVDFFKSVRYQLIGDPDVKELTSSEKQVLEYENSYKPFTPLSINKDKNDMFNSNNGSGNPIHRKTISKLLNIDSRFRPNYDGTTATDYILDLPYAINNVIEIKLCDLELPTTYYPFSDSNENNYFWFATYNDAQVISNNPNIYYFYIPEGNYYFENLIALINSRLKMINTGIVTNDPLPISTTFDLNFNNLGGVGNGTGKLSFGIMPTSPDDLAYNLNHKIVKFDLNFNAPMLTGIKVSKKITATEDIEKYYLSSNIPLQQRAGWMLGYRSSYYTSNMYHISESILNIIGPQYLFLILDDFNKSNNINFLTTSKYGMLPDNIIARISLKSSAFNIQSQNDFSVYAEPRFYYGPVNISKIQIKIVDEFGRTLDLNNNDFSFTLRMTTIYSVT